MSTASDLVEFTPDPSQLARIGTADAPPAWLAIGAIAVALGLSLSLALPPATKITNGSVSGEATRGEMLRITATPNAPADR